MELLLIKLINEEYIHHEKSHQSTEERQLSVTASRLQVYPRW